MTNTNEQLKVRVWTWIRTSPVAEVGWFLLLMWFYTIQHGWQRWLFFAVAMSSAYDFWKKADKQWLKK